MTTGSGPFSASFPSPPNRPVSGSFPSPLASVAMEASRVAEMIEKLPAAFYADGILPLLQQAGLECFFAHVRCMLEFLRIRPQRGDRSALDLLSSWSPPTKDGADAATWMKLNGHWQTATKHVMHFGLVRTMQDDGTKVSVAVEQADLEAIANDVLTLWDQFAEEVANAGLMGSLRVPKRGSFRLWNPDGTSQC